MTKENMIKNLLSKRIYISKKLHSNINLFVILVGVFGCISFLSYFAFENKLAGFIGLICYCIIYFYILFDFHLQEVLK